MAERTGVAWAENGPSDNQGCKAQLTAAALDACLSASAFLKTNIAKEWQEMKGG